MANKSQFTSNWFVLHVCMLLLAVHFTVYGVCTVCMFENPFGKHGCPGSTFSA